MRPEDKQSYIDFMKRTNRINSHTDCSICSKCGGRCCKTGGCGLMTCDLPELTVEGITKMLDSGKYSITFLYSDLFGIIPTMHTREEGADRINNSPIRKACSLLGNKGCTLSELERPTLGLLLIPDVNYECHLLVDAFDSIHDWLPLKSLMEEVIFKETGKTSSELFYRGCIDAAMELRTKLHAGIELDEGEISGLQLLDCCNVITVILE